MAYAFRTDINWLPEARHTDVFLELWKNWYGGRVLAGQADRFHTDLIFYPDGVPLSYTPLNFPYIAMSNALLALVPAFNAYSIGHLLIVFTTALATYVYLLWLFRDKWLALFGAALVAFSPQVAGLPIWPSVAWIAPTPIVLYCVHRGLSERRASLVFLGGLAAGLMTAVVMYQFVCVLIALGLLVCGLAASRWRDRDFWWQVVLLASVIAIACSWRVIPMLQDQEQLDRAVDFSSDSAQSGDLISFFINRKNPILGPFAEALIDQMPGRSGPLKRSYLGFVSLVLLGIGVLSRHTRRRALPWLGLLLVFLVLSLGSRLKINGIVYEDIWLPKHYLDQLLPSVFAAFRHKDHLSLFLIGARLPLAIVACYGLMALCQRFAFAARPAFILLLISVSALERHISVYDPPGSWWVESVSDERLAYLDWLKGEESGNIALVNLPFGWEEATFYVYAQTLSGFPIAGGVTNRLPYSAYDYIRANYILNAWHKRRPIRCEDADRDAYLAAVDALEADGFSHVVFHKVIFSRAQTEASFDGVQASFSDGYVSIYRLGDLRASCPETLTAAQRFAKSHVEAMGKGMILDQRHGAVVVLAPTDEMAERFAGYLHHAGWLDPTVVTVAADMSGEINIRSTASVDLEQQNALWLVKDRLEYNPERTAPNYAWFLARFKLCQRHYEDDSTTIDLYLKQDIPCAAAHKSNSLEARYDGGVRLHNAFVEAVADKMRLYLAWTSQTERNYAFSIQFFGEDGEKAFQIDKVIWRDLLAVYDFDISALSPGVYTIKLIVYDLRRKSAKAAL